MPLKFKLKFIFYDIKTHNLDTTSIRPSERKTNVRY